VIWCPQGGFSEPGNAGSDPLRKASTKAVIGDGPKRGWSERPEKSVTRGLRRAFGEFHGKLLVAHRFPEAPAAQGGIRLGHLLDWIRKAIEIRSDHHLTGDQDFCEVFYDGRPHPLSATVRRFR